MLKLADLPNEEGFHFTGITHEGEEITCTVRKNPVGCHSIYSDKTREPVFLQLAGWNREGARK